MLPFGNWSSSSREHPLSVPDAFSGSVLHRDCTAEGTFSLEHSDLLVKGRLCGPITTEGCVYIAEGGSTLGPVYASRVLVEEGGKATGIIRASKVQIGGVLNAVVLGFNRVSILKSAHVRGAILTASEATFKVALGAHFTGTVRDVGQPLLRPILPGRGHGTLSDSVPTLAHPTDASGASQGQEGTLPIKRPEEEQTTVSVTKEPSGDSLPLPSRPTEGLESDSEAAEDFGVDW